VAARFIYDNFVPGVQYIADVAGGQGLLTRILRKRYQLHSEVIDPRGWVLKGVPARQIRFEPEQALYYDLVVGLHPDQALRSVVEAAVYRPTFVVPCCNYWSSSRIGLKEMLDQMEAWYHAHDIAAERRILDLETPYRIAFVTRPPGPAHDHRLATSVTASSPPAATLS
jgi:hypothetical protein